VLTGFVTAVSAVGIGAVILAVPGQLASAAVEAGLVFGSGLAVLNLPAAAGGLLLYTATAGLAITVPMWAYRAHRNLRVLGGGLLRWSPGWAAGAWFIPVGNLVLCYGVMREIWSGSGSSGSDGGPEPLVWLWWAYWLAAAALAVCGLGLLVMSASGLPLGLLAASMLNAGLDIWPVSWGLLSLLAWRIQARQEVRYREVAMMPAAGA
jgi:hypothetical protein